MCQDMKENENKTGPKTEPCGTPHCTFKSSEDFPLLLSTPKRLKLRLCLKIEVSLGPDGLFLHLKD